MEKQSIFAIITVLLAGVSSAAASENIDSLSYAYGYQYIIASMAGENKLLQSEQDFKDYVSGF